MAILTYPNSFLSSDIKMNGKENLSTRLVHAMATLGMSQSELARRIGIKPQAIQYLCTSNASRSKFAFDIADALGINIDWLLTGQGKMKEKDAYDHVTKIPIIEPENICKWIDSNEQYSVESYYSTMQQIYLDKKCYAIKINDSSMAPRFEIGTVLIVDPSLSPNENDFVVVFTDLSKTPIVRHLIKKNDRFILMPINLNLYKEIYMKNEYRFLGVVRQIFYEFSKR